MRVRITTAQSPTYLPGDAFRLLWDQGKGGEMVSLAEEVPVFPAQELGPVYRQRVFGAGTFSGRAGSACTFGNRAYGAGSFAEPMGSVELLNREISGDGLYRFAIMPYDQLGNASAAWKWFSVWISEEPKAPKNLKATSFDPAANKLAFGFTPSRSLN